MKHWLRNVNEWRLKIQTLSTLCIQETLKQVLLQTGKTEMKSCIMHWGLHYKILRFFFLHFNLTPLDIYNGLSQVYCIKPEERIHQNTKG